MNQNDDIIYGDIFELLGMANISDEQKQAYLAKIQLIVLNQLIDEQGTKYLKDEDLAQLATLGGKAKEMEDYLRSKIPAFDELIKTYTLTLKEHLVSKYRKLQKTS